MSNPMIRVEGLFAYYGDKLSVNNANLTIDRNEIFAVIGPSGCGKSTFLRCLNRLHEEVPKASVLGKVEIDGENAYAKGADPVMLRRKIGMVFQKPTPFPSMSIYENVIAGLKLTGLKRKSELKESCEKALRQAALWDEVKDILHKPGGSLSGGQQQRLCIARTLAVEPPIILFDEPTSALDPISTAKIEELLLKLKKEITIVIVTHNMQQAQRISSKTAFFHLGELVEWGPTETIFKSPRQEKTKHYVGGLFG